MIDINHVVFGGNAVKDSTNQTVASGTPLLKFTLASNKYIPKKGGDPHKTVCYMDVVVFGKIAESIRQIHKGEHVVVIGEIKQDVWEKDGKKNSRYEIVAHHVAFKDMNKKEKFEDDIPFA